MEDHLQTIIGAIIAIFLLFIFPVYMAYEKKDDVSYALALKYTEEFVKTVQKTGYLTKDMYSDYEKKLRVTNNSYDIRLVHMRNKYEPIVNYYEETDDDKLEKVYFTSREYYDNLTDKLKQKMSAKLTYEIYKERYDTNYILNIINKGEKIVDRNTYTMNPGDEFTVIITNTNVTPATLIFNMLTINAPDSIERIYVNYSGKILDSKKYNKAYYSYETTGLISNACELLTIAEDNIIDIGEEVTVTCSCKDDNEENTDKCNYFKNFTVEFDVVPSKVTSIENVGTIKYASEIDDLEIETQDGNINKTLYSLLLNGRPSETAKGIPIYISVGTNGINVMIKTLILNKESYITILSYAVDIYEYTNIRLQVKENTPVLYIDGEEVVVGNSLNDIKTNNITIQSLIKLLNNMYGENRTNINQNFIDNIIDSNKDLYISNYIAKDDDNLGKYYGKVKNLRIYTSKYNV